MSIKTLASNIFLDFSEKEWEIVEQEFASFEKEVELLNKIDTDGVDRKSVV